MDELDVTTMDLEALAVEFDKVCTGLVELKAAHDVIQGEIMAKMKNKQELAGDIILTKTCKTAYDVTLEWAADMGAIKSVIDNERLKVLAKEGIQIPRKEGKPYLIYSRAK